MSGLLLDTHVLLWANGDPGRLGARTTAHLLDPSQQLYVSAVCAAEIAVKRSIGKLGMSVPIAALIEPLGAIELPLSVSHAAATERFPMLHRDPFDRLLAAQADEESMTLVTADERLLLYPIASIDART